LEVTIISATARLLVVLATGTLLAAACSGSNRIESIFPAVNAPPNPAILPTPQYEAQKRSGQPGKHDVKPQEAKRPTPQQPTQVQTQSANAAEE